MKRFVPPSPLCIDDACCVCSVGFDMPTAAAAMRCGVARPTPIDHRAVLTDDGETMPVQGHAADPLTRGFDGTGRFRRLLERLFRDIASPGRTQPPGRATYVLVGVPHRLDPEGTGAASDDAGRPPVLPVARLLGESWHSIAEKAIAAAAPSLRVDALRVVETSAGRSARLLQMVDRALDTDPGACVWLVCVDTLLDGPGLEWLTDTGRLRTPDAPVGAAPGEAAVALRCVRSTSARTALRIESVQFEREPDGAFGDKPSLGRPLARLLGAHRHGRVEAAWWFANLTGEHWSAREWAAATLAEPQRAGGVPDDALWTPARSVGDVGIAFVSLSLGWALQAARRGYAAAAWTGVAVLDVSDERALVSVSLQ